MPVETPTKLAELSRLTGVHIVAPTGLHHERYYGPAHWSLRIEVEELADLFSADIEEGIDANDYSGPVVRRTAVRAGVVKVAGSAGGPSARDARVFAAAAITQRRTAVPILTHCEGGTGALEQLRLFEDLGVSADRVTLSHVDKVVDRGYHRELLATGATAEYDQAFRWGDRENGTLTLLEAMIEDGHADRIVLGMDAARQGYYRVYGGRPGLTYLLDGFSAGDGRSRDRRVGPRRAVRRQSGPRVRIRGGRGRMTHEPTPDRRRRVACSAVLVRRRPRRGRSG